jgi:hypothetical protein
MIGKTIFPEHKRRLLATGHRPQAANEKIPAASPKPQAALSAALLNPSSLLFLNLNLNLESRS